MQKSTVIETIIILNIVLFLYTGIAKIQDFTLFKGQLAENPLLASSSKAIAILLPLIEFIIVVMLAIPRWRLKGLQITFGLMVLFTGYIALLLATSDHLPCSCGGIIEQLSWKQHLLFNGIFIGLDAFAIRLLLQQKKELYKERNEIIGYKISHS